MGAKQEFGNQDGQSLRKQLHKKDVSDGYAN